MRLCVRDFSRFRRDFTSASSSVCQNGFFKSSSSSSVFSFVVDVGKMIPTAEDAEDGLPQVTLGGGVSRVKALLAQFKGADAALLDGDKFPAVDQRVL